MSLGEISRGVRIERLTHLDVARAAAGFDDLGEIEQQIQFEISGFAGNAIGWDEETVEFDVEFVNAVDQRYSNLTKPHFTFGPVITSLTPVLVTAEVRSWTMDSREVISGCVLAIGVCNPGAVVGVGYSGLVDVTFQGFGAPVEYGDVG